MILAVWFIFRLALLLGMAAWVIEHSGNVHIEWQGFDIKTSTSVLLFSVVFIAISFALLYRFYRAFIAVPEAMRRYRLVQGKENGYQAITKGLAAVAAGDGDMADRHAKRARKLLPVASLTGLLTAQAALLNNKEDIAKLEFEALLDSKDAAFFGVRGLINLATKDQDNDRLVGLMKRAEEISPKQPWIISNLFEYQACNGEWEKAEQTLAKAIKLGVMDRSQGDKHRQAILLARSYDAENLDISYAALGFAKKSYKIDIGFVPATVAYARLLYQTNKWRAAVKVIEKTWGMYQHPDLIEIWSLLMPVTRGKNVTEEQISEHSYKWTHRLYRLAPFGKVSNSMLGKVAMDCKKWDDAREFFKIAGDYRLLAKLELKSGGLESKAREWLEMATDTQEKLSWVCHSCGYLHTKWEPICKSCGLFNSVSWTVPQPGTYGYGMLDSQIGDEGNILEPPFVA